MRSLFFRFIITSLFSLLVCASCGLLSDADSEFAMSLNGGPYWAKHEPPTGALLEMESGMNLSYRVRITFPLSGLGGMKKPGLEIEFDPAQIRIGKEISFGPQSVTNHIQLSYFPAFGHNYSAGQLLIFDLGSEGSGSIVFEKIDARYGGQVKGILRQAILYGYYESGDVMNAVTPTSPMKLELRNFPFEVILEEAWW